MTLFQSDVEICKKEIAIREDNKLLNVYAIRKLMLIEKIKFNWYVLNRIDRRDLIKVNLSETSSSQFFQADNNTFMFLLNSAIPENNTTIVEGLCNLFTEQYRIKNRKDRFQYKYNFITDKAFEFFDSKGVNRTFLYTLEFSKEQKMSFIKIKEVKIKEENDYQYEIEPLKYSLGITTNIESYIEPFIKCLKLNDIEIQKGDFEHILMSKKNAKKDLGTGV